jgi:ABC-type branched-subunit amino acid transport system substrate-binding protein
VDGVKALLSNKANEYIVSKTDHKEVKTMKQVTLILAAVIAIVMLRGEWAYAQKAAPPKTLDIGIAMPLTGPAADLGTDVRNTALIAIDDQNAQGGVKIAGEKY